MKIKVIANTNIALVKYWGKRNIDLKLPLNSSISLTLDKLSTNTTIEAVDNFEDKLIFNNQVPSEEVKTKIINFINLFRKDYKKENLKFLIKTENNFPTASGLASSASGFAALAVAMNKILNLELSNEQLSCYARIGSGSACRSVYGGFAEWQKGESDDGSDSFAVQLADENFWDINMLVVIVENEKKSKSSTAGMDETVKTCPFYPVWLSTVEQDLNDVREGIYAKDIEKVGKTMEHNCLKMHSTMFTTMPAIIYWKPATLAVIHKVNEMRENGLHCYFTIDAGANVKILCLPEEAEKIKSYLSDIKEIKEIIQCKAGKSPLVEKL